MLALLPFLLAFFLAMEALFRRSRRGRERWLLLAASAACVVLFALFSWLDGYLKKTIGALLLPAGLLWMAGICAFFALRALDRPRAAGWILGAWLVYSLVGNGVVGAGLASVLERDYLDIDPFTSNYDAVVVLGGGTASRDRYEYLGLSGDRVMLGARLWHTGRTPILVTTGSTPAESRYSHVSAEVTARLWQDIGIPADAILKVVDATDTTEEMRAIAAIVQREGWHRVGLVTSARHMKRAMRNAERFGVELYPLPADLATPSTGGGGVLPFVPQGRGFLLVHTASWELLGILAGQ